MPEKVTKMKFVEVDDFLDNVKSYVPKKIKIMGICGGSGSGKSFIAGKLSKILGARVIGLDDYFIPRVADSSANFELPKMIDLPLIKNNLTQIKMGKAFEKPIYDFKTQKIFSYEEVGPSKLFIFEGLHAFHRSIIRFLDFKIFVESSERIRFERRIERDILERNTEEKKIIERWKKTVEPSYKKIIEPYKLKADLIVVNN